MRAPIARRRVLAAPILAAPSLLPFRGARATAGADAAGRLAELEGRSGGRLGVAVLDAATGRRIGHRADERFPMCSTFKFLAAGFVLARVDRGEESLARRVTFTERDLVPWSPVTKHRTGAAGMTIAELCEAALTLSDNTAGNLLLASFGGPAGLTAYARTLGDGVTRLDRFETALNEAIPGDPRDTTTPAAMLENLRRLVLGDALSGPSREQLTAWLLANRTGDKRLRAGVPKDWLVGDKTGSGNNGATNDIGVFWPPGRAPIIVTAYLAEAPVPEEDRNAVLAEVGRIAAAGA
ncbi:MAG: class A beta-lactamase [Acetobacteraceae bacterium]|nr:class A beta-lactamase [Acetobacteraceae bacterium]